MPVSGCRTGLARHTAALVGGRRAVACWALALAVVPALAAGGSTGDGVRAARMAAVLLAVGLGVSHDDEARELTASLPTGLAARRLHRLAVAVPPFAVLWAAAVAVAGAWAGPVPARDLTVEAVAAASAALALAVVLALVTPERQGGVVVAPALVLGLVLAGLAYRPLLLTDPADARWAEAHRVLAGSAVASALVYTAATVGPDARWRRAARRRRSANPAA